MIERRFEEEPGAGHGAPLPGAGRSPVLTWALLGANVLIFVAASAAGGTENSEVLLDFGAMFGPLIASGEYWRLFTAMFLHVGLAHLFFNGFGLLIFGPLVEKAYGHARFLTIYLLAGLFGSVASYMFNSIAIGAGASGAIFGILGALTAFFITQRKTLGNISQRNLVGLLFLVGINLAYGLATPGIDNWAHMGGFAGGFALGLALAPRYRPAATAFGTPGGVVDVSSMATRWWVVPVAVAVLAAGTLLAGATMPENPYSYIFVAERHFDRQDYDKALEELEKTFSPYESLDPVQLLVAQADAHLLRGRILLELGAVEQAKAELGRAIRFGDRYTRAEASALLVSLLSRR